MGEKGAYIHCDTKGYPAADNRVSGGWVGNGSTCDWRHGWAGLRECTLTLLL